MLGITYHNPATISVFLDRMRFRDCFISNEELRKDDWHRKLKSFVDLPSDGRDRVVFVESFATLQALLQNGAVLDAVKVAVYDDCDVLANVPGANIVDAHINGSSTDTWQLYTVSFDEFNDALASQPNGVPALIRDHDVKEDADIPEPPRSTQQVAVEEDEEDEPDEPDKDQSGGVMKQLLDDIERDEEDDDGDGDTDEPVGNVVLRKREPAEPPPEREPEAPPEMMNQGPTDKFIEKVKAGRIKAKLPVVQAEPEAPPPPPPSRPEPKPKKQKRKRVKAEPPKSYELF